MPLNLQMGGGVRTRSRACKTWRWLAPTACLLAGAVAAFIGLDRGLPEAPWGDEHLRWNRLATGVASLVLLPWLDVSRDALWPAPWARWALVAAGLAVLTDLGSNEVVRRWRISRVGRQGGHVVVVGLSTLAEHLVQHWVARGREVMVLSAEPGQRAAALAAGAAWAQGRLDDDGALHRCRVATAERVVVVGDDDALNIGDALCIARFSLSHRSPEAAALLLWVRVEDPFVAASLESRLVDERTADVVEQKVFSSGQIAARRLLREWPGYLHREEGRSESVWVVVGATPIAEALIVQVLRVEVVHERARPVFVIVAPDAEDFVARLRTRWPGLDALADMQCLALRIEQPVAACEALSLRVGVPDIACLCHENPHANVAGALSWQAAWRLAGRGVPTLYVHVPDQRHAPVVEKAMPGTVVHHFGDLGLVAQELMSGEQLDAMARGVHEGYLRVALSQGEALGARRSLQPWRGLSEDLRTDNRAVADHHFTKLKMAGWSLVPPGSGVRPVWSAEVVERLARLEHERWLRQRILQGWRVGASRNDGQRVHPDLIPYDDLTESRRELDRDVVRQLPAILDEVRIPVYPTRRLLVAGPPSAWAFTPMFEARVVEVLAQVFGGVPPAAQMVWVHGTSAMAWRVVELWMAAGGTTLGVMLAPPLQRVIEMPPATPNEARMCKLASRATQTLRLGAASGEDMDASLWVHPLKLDAVLSLFIVPQASPPGPMEWRVGAEGQVVLPDSRHVGAPA